MTQPSIELIVSPQGESRIETKGFVGSSCRQVSLFLEEALGIKAAETLTAPFYEQHTAQQHLQQGGAG